MPDIRTEQAMTPRDAFFAATEDVKPGDAVGRVSAEWITPYPPGIPAVAAGEVYTDKAVEYLQAVVEAGGFVEGTADPQLTKMRVVA
jgi:arginine/lysine/ornithine decarboxylase